MQQELESTYQGLDIQLIGVNQLGKESGVPLATEGRNIPLLQDVDANGDSMSDAWTLWSSNWRDVVILDADNSPVGTYNLREHDLSKPEDYAALRQMLIDTAITQTPWRNPTEPLDVNKDSFVTATGDVLPVINCLNSHDACGENGRLIAPPTSNPVPFYYDVDGDGYLAAVGDVLPIINFLNRKPAGEGEMAAERSLAESDLGNAEPAFTRTSVGDAGSHTPSRSTINAPTVFAPSPLPEQAAFLPAERAEYHEADLSRENPRLDGSQATLGQDTLDALEPLLVDLAEDLATAWHSQVAGGV